MILELERTSFPLSTYKYEYDVNANGQEDTVIIETKVGLETFFKQPTLGKYIKENDLSLQVTRDNDETSLREVKIFKQGTDWLIEYHFKNVEGNWVLVSTYDYSL